MIKGHRKQHRQETREVVSTIQVRKDLKHPPEIGGYGVRTHPMEYGHNTAETKQCVSHNKQVTSERLLSALGAV